MDGYLVIGENAELRESLGVLLRSQGHTVTLVATSADALRLLRSQPAGTVIIAAVEADVHAAKLRLRLLSERLAERVLLLHTVESGVGGQKTQRFGIGDYRLTERELLALLGATPKRETTVDERSPAERGVEALVQVVDVLVGMQELNDRHFRGSSHRAVELARACADALGLSREEVLEISIATLLRDVGKIGIGDGLLEDRGHYSDAQRTSMREHVAAGVRLLEHIDFPWRVLPIVRHHHERYDGTGYPDGLKGPEIPLGARILCAVDSYIAMLSDRPHRACLSSAEAKAELMRGAGTQFDPEVVEVLLGAIRVGAVSLSSAEKPTVLVADSDAEFVKLLAIRLVNEGMEVRAVASAEEAILKILERPPHLVLASFGSDPERVFHLLREIREDRELRLLPFAFLDERDDRILRLRALRMSADDVLLKRADLGELVARIESMLARDAARRATDVVPEQRGISGTLDHLTLPDIVQILHLGLKTARVTIDADEGRGTLWFDSGNARHAEVDGRTGPEACYEMLRWTRGRFCIEHGLKSEETSIHMSTMGLVMEGLRLVDEAART